MDEDSARMLVGIILALAGIVWLISVRFVATTRRLTSASALPERMTLDAESVAGDTIKGQVTINAPPAGLAGKLARALAQPQVGQLGTIKILESSDNKVVFEQSAPFGRGKFKTGVVEFSASAGNKTLAEYQITSGLQRGLLITAQALLLLGPVAIVGCGWLMERFVISSPQAAVRWQVIQSLQVVHVLWPPFLFAGIYRGNRRWIIAAIESLLVNLPHLA